MTSTSALHRSDSLESDSPTSDSLQSSTLLQSSSLQSNSIISSSHLPNSQLSSNSSHPDPLQPIRDWLEHLQVRDSKTAHRIAKLIPSQCPFERDLKLFGRTLVHIPPLCKLNPFYDEFVGLRFRALCYLVDECGEDIQYYC
jgi:hypothetical protein